ncbi:MAG: S1C family serine protease [Anaerolineae bacterium]|nr:S1C family serine protease [Anaerolineae bacterium]
MAKNDLKALSDSMADAVEKASSYVVTVDARRRFPATGIAYAPGLILTADHVVQRDEDIKVTLPDGAEHSAEVVGRDPGSDLCLLRIEKEPLSPAEIAASARVGQLALALGRPSSGGVQASLGIVSALSGPAHTRHGGLLSAHIRTDAIPYPGFSGGPLVDAGGKLLGLNTSGLGHGNSIAIPAELAWGIAASLAEHGSVKRGFLGIRSQPVEVSESAQKSLGRSQETGLLLIGVETESPAATAGLMVGDILVGFNGQVVSTPDQLLGLLVGEVVGSPAPVEIIRAGKAETIQITAAERSQPDPESRRSHRRRWRGRRHAFWMGPTMSHHAHRRRRRTSHGKMHNCEEPHSHHE